MTYNTLDQAIAALARTHNPRAYYVREYRSNYGRTYYQIEPK